MNNIITYKAIYTLYNKEVNLFINDYIISQSCNLDSLIEAIKNRYYYYESIIKDNINEFINKKEYNFIKKELKQKSLKNFILSRIKIIQEIKIENDIILGLDFLEV